MACPVVFNAVPGRQHALAQFWMRCGALANAKKRGAYAVLRQDGENLRGYLGIGAVINGDGHFSPLHCGSREAHQIGAEAGAAWPQSSNHEHQLTE